MKVDVHTVATAAISGTRWSTLGAVVSSLCSLGFGIVLARVLGPRPYGEVIIASTIYGFVNLFVDGGFGQALIQKPELDEREIRRTFTFQVAIAAKITAAIYLLAPWIARQFHDPSATHVIRAMSFMVLVQSLGLVSAALLRRRMQFKAIQCATLTSLLVGTAGVSVPLALLGAGVWSLVAGLLCQCALNSLLLYARVRHSIAPCFRLPERRTTIFGGTIVATNLVNWGHANLDNLAASQLGPVGLGLYGRACNFGYQPVLAAVTGLQTVLLSTAAKTTDRRRLVGNLAMCLLAIVFGLLGSAYAVLALIPDTTIIGLFGDKWMGVIPLMLPLAIAMPMYALHCLLGPIVCGLGRPALEFWPQAITCGIAALAFFVAGHHSILAVAWALAGVMLLRFLMIAGFAFRLLSIRWRRAVRVLVPRGLFAIAFGVLAWVADQLLRTPLHLAAAPRLAVLVVLCTVALSATVWIAGDLIFGTEAVEFLLSQASHLPAGYVRQLRVQAHYRPTTQLGGVTPAAAPPASEVLG